MCRRHLCTWQLLLHLGAAARGAVQAVQARVSRVRPSCWRTPVQAPAAAGRVEVAAALALAALALELVLEVESAPTSPSAWAWMLAPTLTTSSMPWSACTCMGVGAAVAVEAAVEAVATVVERSGERRRAGMMQRAAHGVRLRGAAPAPAVVRVQAEVEVEVGAAIASAGAVAVAVVVAGAEQEAEAAAAAMTTVIMAAMMVHLQTMISTLPWRPSWRRESRHLPLVLALRLLQAQVQVLTAPLLVHVVGGLQALLPPLPQPVAAEAHSPLRLKVRLQY